MPLRVQSPVGDGEERNSVLHGYQCHVCGTVGTGRVLREWKEIYIIWPLGVLKDLLAEVMYAGNPQAKGKERRERMKNRVLMGSVVENSLQMSLNWCQLGLKSLDGPRAIENLGRQETEEAWKSQILMGLEWSYTSVRGTAVI